MSGQSESSLDDQVRRIMDRATAGQAVLDRLTERHDLNDSIVLLMPEDSADLNRTCLSHANRLSARYGVRRVVVVMHDDQAAPEGHEAVRLAPGDMDDVLTYVSVNPHIPLRLYVCSLDRPAGRDATPYASYDLSLDELVGLGIFDAGIRDRHYTTNDHLFHDVEKNILKIDDIRRGALVIYGADAAATISKVLYQFDIIADLLVDDAPEKRQAVCGGLRVSPVESMRGLVPDDSVVLVASRDYEATRCRLAALGNWRVHDVGARREPAPVSSRIFENNKRAIRVGLATYRELTAVYGHDCRVFVYPSKSIGDAYVLSLFFNEYIRRNGITRYVYVVPSAPAAQVLEFFDIRNVIIRDWPATVGMSLLALHLDPADFHVTDFISRYVGHTSLGVSLLHHSDVHIEAYTRVVFGLDETAKMHVPVVTRGEEAKARELRAKGLVRDRTVILAPYSRSADLLPWTLWTRLAESLKIRGYAVFTNVASKYETSVPGTSPLTSEIRDAADTVEFAGHFIGLRSGLCDIVSSARCRRIFLYASDAFFTYNSPSSLGLPGASDSIDVNCTHRSDEEVLTDVLRHFPSARAPSPATV